MFISEFPLNTSVPLVNTELYRVSLLFRPKGEIFASSSAQNVANLSGVSREDFSLRSKWKIAKKTLRLSAFARFLPLEISSSKIEMIPLQPRQYILKTPLHPKKK